VTLVQRLDLRQTQSLVMTPQLQQAIKLLQLNNLEISEFVMRELEQNPLLEEDGRTDHDRPLESSEASQDRVAAPGDDDRSSATDDQASRLDEGALDGQMDNFVDGLAGGDSDGPLSSADGESSQSFGLSGSGGGFDGELPDFAERLSQEPTLRDHLLEQLNTEIEDPKDRMIGAALIEMMEPSGYLSDGAETPAQIAEALGIPVAQVEAVLFRLQRFDPAGILARNLAECLALQLQDRNRFDPAMAALCANLNLLAERRFSDLTRICGVDAADLADMIREIRALNPKPGDLFESAPAAPVIPDILMRPARGGGWAIELNSETLPRVLVNRRYYSEVSHTCRTAADREYLAERLNAANWLVRSLDQRAQTILKVAAEIVAQQEEFFKHGISRLKPLVLRNIAEIIGMHESTVSRVTSNKYISTPRGMFELKFFFSTAIQRSDGGESFAAEAIRHRLKTLIDAEDPKNILSDDTLVEQLQGEGMDIARRTVAKYREQLGIPSSVQRRRQKSFSSAATR
jgi:RNA polymerase sigma-54 factor